MKIMVVGGGGREHAIIKKLKENKSVEKIFALPGNGGIASDAECVNIAATDIEAILNFAVKNSIDFAVVAPDDPLVLGAVDALHSVGIKCFGPSKSAAIIEGSKVFSKELMSKYAIPTADCAVFTDASAAIKYLKKSDYPTVIKADGLALGKGVIIAENFADAKKAVEDIMEAKIFGESGNRIVIEEFLTGPEVSVLSFTDSHTVVPMISSMDHKRAGDGDTGLNTGGMGVIAPNPFYTKELEAVCMKEIFLPTVEAMKKEGRPFKGCLYFGLMLTPKGPKVIEYNCRFGDPEAQAVLALLETDLLDVMLAVENETLCDMDVKFSDGAACCLCLTSGGYPSAYKKGMKISFGEIADKDVSVIHAGTALDGEGNIVTSGGRVLGVVAVADDLKTAVKKSYEAAKKIDFKDMQYRRDIGKKALEILK